MLKESNSCRTVLFLSGLMISIIFLKACQEESINTPPSANLVVFPYAGDSTTIFTFDASKSSDNEDIVEKLSARWDWENDGTWDTDFSHQLKVLHRFTGRGIIYIRMELSDSEGLEETITDSIRVFELPVYGSITDPRDGRIYKTVKMEGNWWMAENLRYGRQIPDDTVQSDNQRAEYYGYDNDPDLAAVFGGLYTWYEAMDYVETEGGQGLCPPGWHIPSLREWKTNARSDVPYLFLNYFLGPGGPGGLNLRYDGLYVIYTEKNGGIINRKFFSGLGDLAGFWTSTTRENTLQTWAGNKAVQRSNYGLWLVDIQNNGIGSWDRNGLFPGGDLIHLSGDTLVYEIGAGSYKHFRVAYFVRCIKPE